MSQPHLDLPAQPGKQRRAVVALSVAGVIIALSVLLFAAFSSHFLLIGPAPAPTPVKDWQTYNDPSGHFTMRMPADWEEFETGHGSSSSAGISFQMTTYSFASQDRIPNTPPQSRSMSILRLSKHSSNVNSPVLHHRRMIFSRAKSAIYPRIFLLRNMPYILIRNMQHFL